MPTCVIICSGGLQKNNISRFAGNYNKSGGKRQTLCVSGIFHVTALDMNFISPPDKLIYANGLIVVDVYSNVKCPNMRWIA